jgi:DNA-binding protein HU-beta
MTKKELTQHVATKTAVPQGSAGEAVDAVMEGISQALTGGDNVTLKGFGTFRLKQTKARTGRNPKTGEAVQIPAKKKLSFIPAKELKARIQG